MLKRAQSVNLTLLRLCFYVHENGKISYFSAAFHDFAKYTLSKVKAEKYYLMPMLSRKLYTRCCLEKERNHQKHCDAYIRWSLVLISDGRMLLYRFHMGILLPPSSFSHLSSKSLPNRRQIKITKYHIKTENYHHK